MSMLLPKGVYNGTAGWPEAIAIEPRKYPSNNALTAFRGDMKLSFMFEIYSERDDRGPKVPLIGLNKICLVQYNICESEAKGMSQYAIVLSVTSSDGDSVRIAYISLESLDKASHDEGLFECRIEELNKLIKDLKGRVDAVYLTHAKKEYYVEFSEDDVRKRLLAGIDGRLILGKGSNEIVSAAIIFGWNSKFVNVLDIGCGAIRFDICGVSILGVHIRSPLEIISRNILEQNADFIIGAENLVGEESEAPAGRVLGGTYKHALGKFPTLFSQPVLLT